MWKKSFIQYVCNKHFFCEIDKTNGTKYKPKSRKNAKRKRDEKLSPIERVDIDKDGSYCRSCYKKWCNIIEIHSQKRRNFSSKRLGCKGCE